MVEGLAIALVSWLGGLALAIPLSPALAAVIGSQFIHAPLAYTFSIVGAAIWLAGVLAIGALATLLPALNATRLRVRDVLAYE
jgi:ABC-type antimicrobial peptide transport system permease subunit